MKAFFNIGKVMVMTADVSRLLNVGKGITSASTISAMYIHVIGPKDNPKIATKRIKPHNISQPPAAIFWLNKTKPIVIITNDKLRFIVPNCMIDFLPNFESK